MARGGPRPRGGGPAPDPNALRRERDSGDWVTLPPEGRQGPAPEWPLVPKMTARERTLWGDHWAKPQAIMWERNGQQVEVALYTRRLAEAEQRDTSVALNQLVKQLAEGLGLTIPGMHRSRWIIGQVEAPAAQGFRPGGGSRDRLKLVGE
jgi:hypothetical protein